MWRCGIIETRGYYIYTVYTSNLGFEIAVPGREREQSRFTGSSKRAEKSSERARKSIEGARESTEGAREKHRGSKREYNRAVQRRSRWEPEMASHHSA